jgi:hypothetical protein
MIKETENALISALQTKMSDLGLALKIEPFPEKPEEYKLLHPTGALLVRYAGSEFDDLGADQILTQMQTLRWEVHVLTRGLQTPNGAYAVMDAVMDSIAGEKIGGGTMEPEQDGFLFQEGSVWAHMIVFKQAVRVVYK